MRFFISIASPLLVGAIASFFTLQGIHGWYADAVKPPFNPPDWIFAPVWTILYIMMGIALWLVWKDKTAKPHRRTALILFSAQLVLNFAWSFIFFYAHQPGWAFVEIMVMWVLIMLTIVWFGKISPAAAWLLVPYIWWVSFAALLNFYIWKLN